MSRTRSISLATALVFVFVSLICGPIRAATAPPPPKGGSGKPGDKATVQPKSGGGLDQKTIDEQAKQIEAAEGDTASAIRGLTAATQPNSPASGTQVKTIELKGALSPDSENAKNDPDPPFAGGRLARIRPALITTLPANRMYLKDVPNASAIVTKAASNLGKRDINVALLGQHKYMIQSCLGVKVSVGEFTMKLGDAGIKIVDEGIVASYKIDKISFNAFSLRFRPDVFDVVEPCHFSGRVSMSGEANDVVVELRYNPVIDIEKCRVGEPGHVYVHVDVGKIHLAPLPNGVDDLTNCFKDMVVDAVNACLYYAQESQADPFPMILNQIVQTTDDVLEVDCPFTHTETGKTAIGAVKSAGTPITAGTPAASPTTAAAAAATSAFTIKPIPNAKGRLGHLNLKMPAASKDSKYVICKAGDTSQKSLKAGYGAADEVLIPGKYDVYISNKLVPAVEVQPISETLVAIGAIKVNAGKDTKYNVLDANGKTLLHSGYGAGVVALPAGNYFVEVSGSSAPVEVKADEVTEF